MKQLFIVACAIAAGIGFYASTSTSAQSLKVVLEGGKHAGQCVSIESFETAHASHGETWSITCN